MYTKFYSVQEFAKLVGLNQRTIYRSIKSGKINVFRPGMGKKASYRIPESEIERLFVMREEYE